MILLLSSNKADSKMGVGVYKKNIGQVNAYKDLGYETIFGYMLSDKFVFEFSNDRKIEINLLQKGVFNKQKVIFKKVFEICKEYNVKLIHARWEYLNFYTYLSLASLRRTIKVYLEIPTFPIYPQRMKTLRDLFKAGDYSSLSKSTIRYIIDASSIPFVRFGVDRIINFNGYDRVWGIKAIPLSNGVSINSLKIKKINQSTEIRIVAVANIAVWHGYDRVLYGLHEYYKNSLKNNIDTKVFFDVIGEGREKETLLTLCKKLDIEDYVIFHGYKVGEELDAIFDNSNVAVNLLGMHRIDKVKNVSSLKEKEYCAKGIPFICSSTRSLGEVQKYIYEVPSDESPVDIEGVLNFLNNIGDMDQVIKTLRGYALNNFDWSIQNKKIIDDYSQS